MISQLCMPRKIKGLLPTTLYTYNRHALIVAIRAKVNFSINLNNMLFCRLRIFLKISQNISQKLGNFRKIISSNPKEKLFSECNDYLLATPTFYNILLKSLI